jgi:propionate CoA-transferase
VLAMAQAARNSGGLVIAQVERLCTGGTLPGRDVRVPGILVDALIVDPEQEQTYTGKYNPAYSGELRVALPPPGPSALDARRIIARRACLELEPGSIVNLGFGISTGITAVLADEGVADAVTLTVEQGAIGGMPVSGIAFGAAVNYEALIEQPAQFDFYDGGGLDVAFLSFAEVDGMGNVNVSRFRGRPNGSGGFIHIAQNAKAVCFLGTLTAGGLETSVRDGRLEIAKEGAHRRFVASLEQRTFDRLGPKRHRQRVKYITERAVLEADGGGLVLTEIAPGVDLARDVLSCFAVPPRVSAELATMPACVFQDRRMGLAEDFAARPGPWTHDRIVGLVRRGLPC